MSINRLRRAVRGGFGLAVAAGAAMALVACGGGGSTGGQDGRGGGSDQTAARGTPEAPGKADNSLTMIALQDPGTLDYTANNQTALILWIPGNVVEPLVYFDENGEAEPAVAESWTINEDQTEYVFQIREATFSNGEPVTADDVVYSLNTMRESPIQTYSSALAAVESVEATGEREVTVKLSGPSQSFWRGMGGMPGLIQPESAADGIATNPIGTGPYVLDEYVTDDRFVFSVNENYWGEKPSIEKVTVRIIPDGTAALNALAAGEVDSFPVITIDLWERLTTEGFDETFDLVTYPQVGEMLFVIFNQEVEPYSDPAVRAALAKTFDRDAILAAFNAPWGADPTCGYGLSDDSWFAPASADTCPYPTDPDAAAQEIAALGLDATDMTFESLSDVPDLSLPADILMAQLTGAGASVERNAMELARYSQTIFQARPPQFGITVMSSAAPIHSYSCPDPDLAGWTTYCSEAFTTAISKADAATSVEEYDTYMLEANEVLKEDAVIVPLAAKNGVGLFHPDLKGWQEPKIMVDIQFKNLHW